MKASVETITPEIAAAYLEHNMKNRSLSSSTVNAYAADMRAGNWQLNGEAIKFNKRGELIDGQHRLMAVVLSGVTISMVVIRDIDEDVNVMDYGRKRSITDILRIGGMDEVLAKKVWAAVARQDLYMMDHTTNCGYGKIEKYLHEHADAIRKLSTLSTKKSVGITLENAIIMLSMLHALEAGEDFDRLSQFASILRSGLGLSPADSAAVIIRNDILLKKLPMQGGSALRTQCVISIENAIYDFCRGIPRTNTYTTAKKGRYCNSHK